MTDGLPVIPATPENTRKMLDFAGLNGQEILAAIPERARILAAEKVAIAAVMAGCKSSYMPIVAAIVRAMGDPRFGVHGPTASTAGAAILTIVNGPLAHEVGINGGDNLFGPGFRANAAIGRAIRLVLMNLAGAKPGILDRSTFGHAGKYTYCIGEREDLADQTLAELRGYERQKSTVTVFACEGTRQIRDDRSRTPEQLLSNIAAAMSVSGTMILGMDGECVVIIGPEHWSLLKAHGFGKQEIRKFLFEHAGRSRSDLEALHFPVSRLGTGDWIPLVTAPEHILLLVGGGDAGRSSVFIPGWTNRASSQAVTRPILDHDACEIQY